MSLRNMQRAIVPNIPILRGLVAWFDAVSDAIDSPPGPPFPPFGFHASGLALANGTWNDGGATREGFIMHITHAVPGTFDLTLSHPVDNPVNYICQASLCGASITFDSIAQIAVTFNGTDTIRVRMRDIKDAGAGEFTMQGLDHDFYVSVYRIADA